MNNVTTADTLTPEMLVDETPYFLTLPTEAGLPVIVPFRLSTRPAAEAVNEVILHSRDKLDILRQLNRYPGLFAVLADFGHEIVWNAFECTVSGLLKDKSEIVYIFGAHKVGAKIARICAKQGLTVAGFLDNDVNKQGQQLEGLPILAPSTTSIGDALVVIASGRFSNQILNQANQLGWSRVLNLHHLLFCLRSEYGAESDARQFSAAVYQQPYRFVSAFLQLDDERSRAVFDGLVKMRATLDTTVLEDVKSRYQDEYLESPFIEAADVRHYVDAGAFTGDTLARIEERFGDVEHAYLFEPELPAYYTSLERYSTRANVFSYNFGLAPANCKFTYRPELSCDQLNEIRGPIPTGITTFGQGVRLDDIVSGPVSMFKLDIEGAEAGALRGAANIIRSQKPKLSVCAYHRADDLWKLIDEVKQIHPEYRVGVRHYSDILEDTTLYFY